MLIGAGRSSLKAERENRDFCCVIVCKEKAEG